MNKKSVSYCIVLFFLITGSHAQSVGIGTTTPHSSAQLDVSSSSKGTLITTMTSAQRKSIASPAIGLLVFDIDKKTIYMFDGSRWLPLLFSTVEKNPPTYLQPFLQGIDDNLGYKVSINGDYAIVGAYLSSSTAGGSHAGKAMICFRDNGVWEIQATIGADDGAPDDFFGSSVSINDNFAVVGAPGDDVGADLNQGSVYIFSRVGTNWSQQSKISASDGLANDFFGHSIDISPGNFMVIGAYGDDIGGNSNQGSAYIFKGTAGLGGFIWTQEAKLTASDGDAGDNFGFSVSIYASFAVIGAFGDDIGGNIDQGSVYSFYELTNPAGWTTGQAYHQKITAADGADNDYFGVSVDMINTYLIIGASGDDIGTNSDQGSAYSYFRNPFGNLYSAPDKLTAADGAPNDNFGISVSRSLTQVVVGAYRAGDGNGVVNPGSVYVYNAGGSVITFRRKVEDDSAESNGYFGYSVSAEGYNIIIGAYGKSNNRGEIAFLNVQ